MMKQLPPKAQNRQLTESNSTLSQLKALRLAQKESNQRVEELKMRLFHITEQHMDQAVRLIKRWLADKE
ncbi:flagellar M-ring protein FliF [uncultured Desulfovibrio sp.]|uniref:flagellar M-ring protein FliF n=1 Tax=uncultured Desulfovibrio sp. TaxID=167968 RepID=UPI002620B431|nr:flagellar M-ring protein FliF [uncultured Desulfovibrio sp.]